MTQHRAFICLLASALASVLVGACASQPSGGADFVSEIADDRPRIREATRLDAEAQAAYEDDKPDVAERLWREAIATAEDYWAPHHNLGVFYAEGGNYLGAVQQLRRAAELAPGDYRPLYHLGVAYYKAGYAEQALDAFRRARSVQSREPLILRGILRACRALNHADPETLEAMRSALLVEQNLEWRDSFQREIRRQERQLDEEMRRG